MQPVAKAPVGTLHYVEELVYKAEKALIAAKFNGISITTNKFDAQKDSKNPAFLAKNPTGKVPFLETDMGCIFTSNSIARYIARCRADTPIYGKCFDDEGQIDTWLEFCTHELEVPLMTWVYPTMGMMQDVPKMTESAKADTKKALQQIESRLKAAEYLVGDFLSLADIVLVCALREGFVRVFDNAFRAPFPKVCNWFERCCALPQFKAVLGSVKLCVQAAKPVPVKAEPAAKGGKEDKKAKAAAPKEDKKEKAAPQPAAPNKSPKQSPAAAPAPSAAGGDVEAKIKEVGDEIRVLKDKLKGEGLSGKKINDHEDIKTMVAKLQELKTQMPAGGASPAAKAAPAPTPASPSKSPKAAPAAAPAAGGDIEAQVKAVGDEIRVLKEKLKGEGLSGKKVNEHENVKALVAKLSELKAQAPAGGASPAAPAPGSPAKGSPKQAPGSPKQSPKGALAAAPAGGDDIEAQIKAVGDEVRVLKEKLKGEGLSGKKVNDHAEVKTLVAKLQELKAKM